MTSPDPHHRIVRFLQRAAYHQSVAQAYLAPLCDTPTATSRELATHHQQLAARWRRFASMVVHLEDPG